MKKHSILIRLAALLAASAVLSACAAPAEPEQEETGTPLYYLLPADEA